MKTTKNKTAKGDYVYVDSKCDNSFEEVSSSH